MNVLAEGTMLGKYKIVRLLGTGGMADVYEAEDSQLGRRVALKVLPPEFGRDETAVARFEKEVRAAASLNHANIVTIFEVDRADDIHFCAMRLLGGGDLRARIDKGLTEAQALAITREIAQAFVHAHAAGFVHRDVKPENILFDDQGRAILTDFGIAKAIHSQSKMTATGVSIGTPRYISPEQARGQTVDGRADLYSLGAILYEMLSGKPPFEAEDSLAMIFKHVTEPVPRLPEELARYQPLIDSLMAKEPERRPENAAALVALLNALPPPSSRAAPARAAAPAQAPAAAAETPAKVGTGERAYAERLVQEEQRQREAEARRRASADAAAAPAAAASASASAPAAAATAAPAAAPDPAPRVRRSVLAATPTAATPGEAGGSRAPIFAAVAAILLGGGLLVWWLASPDSGTPTDATAPAEDNLAAAATPAPATPGPTPKAVAMAAAAMPTAIPTAAPTATAAPAVDESARRKAEAEKKRKQQEAERKRREALAAAATPAPALTKAEQLARERKLCKRHVSDLFPGWDFTYADMAEYPGVKKLGDGRLNTPPLATDYGDELRYEIDRNGCIVAVLQ